MMHLTMWWCRGSLVALNRAQRRSRPCAAPFLGRRRLGVLLAGLDACDRPSPPAQAPAPPRGPVCGLCRRRRRRKCRGGGEVSAATIAAPLVWLPLPLVSLLLLLQLLLWAPLTASRRFACRCRLGATPRCTSLLMAIQTRCLRRSLGLMMMVLQTHVRPPLAASQQQQQQQQGTVQVQRRWCVLRGWMSRWPWRRWCRVQLRRALGA